MALSSKNRLSGKRNLNAVFKEGRATKGSFLFIKIAENNNQSSRFGFVISVKSSGKAVTRNKIRRELSDFLRANMVKIKAGYDIMVIIKNGSIDIVEIKKDLADTLKRAKVML